MRRGRSTASAELTNRRFIGHGRFAQIAHESHYLAVQIEAWPFRFQLSRMSPTYLLANSLHCHQFLPIEMPLHLSGKGRVVMAMRVSQLKQSPFAAIGSFYPTFRMAPLIFMNI